MSRAPDVIIYSPHLPATLGAVASALTLTDPVVLRTAVDYLLQLLGHECIAPVPPPDAPLHYAAPIKAAIQQTGQALISGLFYGLASTFEDTSSAITAFRQFAERFPNELVIWLPAAAERLPPNSISPQDMQHFMQEFSE
jgi:hypothetical protein